MAVTLLQIARVFATKVPGKIDADVLQLLWKVSDYSFLQISYFEIYCVLSCPKHICSSVKTTLWYDCQGTEW